MVIRNHNILRLLLLWDNQKMSACYRLPGDEDLETLSQSGVQYGHSGDAHRVLIDGEKLNSRSISEVPWNVTSTTAPLCGGHGKHMPYDPSLKMYRIFGPFERKIKYIIVSISIVNIVKIYLVTTFVKTLLWYPHLNINKDSVWS